VVDWAKKIQKHSGSELHPGEQIEAGTFVQSSGSLGKQVGFGVGGVVGAVAAHNMGKGPEASEGGDGATFPQTRMVLGLSTGRLMAFAHGSMSGKPKEMLTSVALSDVAGMTAEKNKISYTLTISFNDASHVSYEAMKMVKPAEFVAAFERLKG